MSRGINWKWATGGQRGYTRSGLKPRCPRWPTRSDEGATTWDTVKNLGILKGARRQEPSPHGPGGSVVNSRGRGARPLNLIPKEMKSPEGAFPVVESK